MYFLNIFILFAMLWYVRTLAFTGFWMMYQLAKLNHASRLCLRSIYSQLEIFVTACLVLSECIKLCILFSILELFFCVVMSWGTFLQIDIECINRCYVLFSVCVFRPCTVTSWSNVCHFFLIFSYWIVCD